MQQRRWIWLAACVFAALVVLGTWRMRPADPAPESGEATLDVAPKPKSQALVEMEADAPAAPAPPPPSPSPSAPAERPPADPPWKAGTGEDGAAVDAEVLALLERYGDTSGAASGGFASRDLEDFGYEPEEVDRLREAWEESRGDLESRLAGIDPGLPRSEARAREQQARQEVLDELIEELGPEDADAARWAGGDPNRLEVSWVPEQSLQNEMGLQAGDRIVSVGGESFNSRVEYQQWLGTRPRTGELVPVEIDRGGTRVVLNLPDGNLGPAVKEVPVPPIQ